jgi:hypothetical protein
MKLVVLMLVASAVLCGFSLTEVALALRTSQQCLQATTVNPSTGVISGCTVAIACDGVGESCMITETPAGSDPIYSHCKCRRFGEYLPTDEPASGTTCHAYVKKTGGQVYVKCTAGGCESPVRCLENPAHKCTCGGL